MATFVHKLRSSINVRCFHTDQPETVFVDLGGGFYKGCVITEEFKVALRTNHLKAFHGNDASVQPGRSGDLWPHETAISWMRYRLRVTLPQEPWNETEDELGARLKAAAEWVNHHHDVEGLCKQMPRRMCDLVHETKGDQLSR